MPLTLCAMNVPHATFEERVYAAHAAGYSAIGISIDQYRRALSDEGLTPGAMRQILRRDGVTVDEVEGPWDWLSRDDESRANTALVFRIVHELGCRQVTAVQFFPADHDQRIVALQSLCDTAARHGVRVAVEFMPFSLLPTVGDAWQLVSAADRENLGLVLDVWHLSRTDGWRPILDTIPTDRLLALQLCDAAPHAEMDLRDEARHRRLLPASGSTAAVRLLRERGFAGRYSTEVWNDEIFALPPRAAAKVLYQATVAAIDAARATT